MDSHMSRQLSCHGVGNHWPDGTGILQVRATRVLPDLDYKHKMFVRWIFGPLIIYMETDV